jgi:hypothetical protein
VKAAIYQGKTILIPGKTEDCLEISDRLLPRSEKELRAFARAVDKLFGSAHVGQSMEDWVEEFESIDWPAGGAIPDWRRVTIVAAARLASRVESKTEDQERRTTDDKFSKKERHHHRRVGRDRSRGCKTVGKRWLRGDHSLWG